MNSVLKIKFKKKIIAGLVPISLIFCLPDRGLTREVRYKLKNGDTLSGRLVESETNKNKVTIINSILGKMVIERSSIKRADKENLWSNEIEVGLDGSNSGNNKVIGYSIDSNTSYKSSKRETIIDTNLDYSKQSNNNSSYKIGANKISVYIRDDRIVNQKWNAYLLGNYKYNGLSKVGMNNIKTSFGIAYKKKFNKNQELKLSIGPVLDWISGGSECNMNNDCDRIYTGSNLGADFDWLITDQLVLKFGNSLATTFATDIAISNTLETQIRFYPDKAKKTYTAIQYNNIYSELTEPKQENSYKITIGTHF